MGSGIALWYCFFFGGVLELFGHWYLFWSDVVASVFTGTRFPGVHGFRHLEVYKSPWSLRGSRGYAPHGYMGLMVGHAACCTQYTRCCPFWSLYRCGSWSPPATTVGEWWRHHSLRRHKEGPWTVLFLPPRIVAGWLLTVAFKVSPNLTKYWGNPVATGGREADSCRSDGRAIAAWHQRGHGHAREGR